MKNILVVFTFICFTTFSLAQRHEIGLMLSNPNLISDIGDAHYIQAFPKTTNPKNLPYGIGFIYRRNFNPQMGLRLNLGFNHVVFNDKKAREDYRTARGFSGKNNIMEAAVIFEYNFFDINDEQHFAQSPYIFGGVATFMSKDRLYRFEHVLFTDAAGNPITPTNTTDFQTNVYYDEKWNSGFSIPFGIGYKFKFSYNWVFSIETGVRFTNSDRLDYSVANYKNYQDDRRYIAPELDQSFYTEIASRESNFKASRITGNIVSRDWYVVSGFSLTYTFGRPPCFCKN